MSLTLQSWLDQSVAQARRQLPDAAVTRLEVLGNALFQEAMQKLARGVGGDPNKRKLLLRAKTVTFTNGAGTLSDDVLAEYAGDSTLLNTTSTATISKRYSLETLFSSFVRVYDRRIGYYFIKEHAIQIIEPGASYAQGSGLTGSRSLTIPCVPDVPTTASGVVDIVEELASDAVAVLADLIVGKMSEELVEA